MMMKYRYLLWLAIWSGSRVSGTRSVKTLRMVCLSPCLVLLGCLGPMGASFEPSDIEASDQNVAARLAGEIEVPRLAEYLRVIDLIDRVPSYAGTIYFSEPVRTYNELRRVLREHGYDIAGRSLIRLAAAHPSDQPDELGFPGGSVDREFRPPLVLEVWTVSAGADLSALTLSGGVLWYRQRGVAGVPFSYSDTVEVLVEEAVVTDGVVSRRLVPRSAGRSIELTAGPVLSGVRLSGTVSDTAFSGIGNSISGASFQVESDIPIGEFVPIAAVSGVSGSISRRSIGAGASALLLVVRVLY